VQLLNVQVTGGTVKALNGGAAELEFSTILGGTLNNVSGTLGTLSVPNIANFATLDGSTAAGAVTIQGTYTADAGTTTHLLGTINNNGNLLVLATATLNLQADTTLEGGGTLTLENIGANVASIRSSAAGLTLTNVDNTIQGAAGIAGPGLSIANQAGGTILSNAPGAAIGIDAAALMNAGTVQVNPNSTLVVNAAFTQTGGKTQVDGLLTVSQGELVIGGAVLGKGNIVGNMVFANPGTMQPGDPGSPGTLTIIGDYHQFSSSTFEELISGNGNGLLVVDGNVFLGAGSLLDIDFVDGFKPFDGEAVTIMEFLNGSGVFANAPSTGFEMGGFDWTILYGPNSIVLDAVAPVEGGGGGTSVPEPGTGALLLGAIAIMFCASLLRKRLPAPRT